MLLAWLALPSARAAAAAPAQAFKVRGCDLLSPAPLVYRFGTGSRPAAPAIVAPDGRAYVATSEGYLHALDPRGGFAWGYTLPGPVTGRPALGSSGAVLVPTGRRVHAIRPDGSLLWVFSSPVPVLGDLVRDGLGRFFFGSEDGRLLALSGGGGLVSFIPGRGAFSTLTTSLPGGAIAAAHENGSVVLSRANKNQKFELGRPATALLPCPGADLCAIVDGSLVALGKSGVTAKFPAERAAASGDTLVALTDARRLALFRASASEPHAVVDLPYPLSADPVVDGRGQVFVPLSSGALLVLSTDGRPRFCNQLARSPLGLPVLDDPRHRVLVTAGEGVLSAIEVE